MQKLSRRKFIGTAVGIAGAAAFPASAAVAAPAGATLYARLGGYDAIAAVVDDVQGRWAKDAQLGKFFVGFSQDSLRKIRQRIVELFCEAAGGPCFYTGRDMQTAHKGMGLSTADWQKAAGHLVVTLDKFKVPEKEKNELLAFVTKL
jgi:hemoglobin